MFFSEKRSRINSSIAAFPKALANKILLLALMVAKTPFEMERNGCGLNGSMNVVDMVYNIFRTAASSFFILDGFRLGCLYFWVL